MANSNKGLNSANKAKKDEFYTRLEDVERELGHYRDYFRGKTIFCNCDDPAESNFWKYFELNFDFFGLKKLISTHFETDKPSYKLEMFHDINGDGQMDAADIVKTPLLQNGDFRSPECVEIMKEADVVVTNPPFSLFREYIKQLMDNDKKFIVVGHQNAITYKEIFPLLKDNKIWLGYGFPGNAAFFINKHYEDTASSGQHKDGMIRVSGVTWYTNIDIKKRHENMILFRTYKGHESEYPKYDNYDAVNVDKVKDIPIDYKGVMGVPITFMDKYSPEQFEILNANDFITNKNTPKKAHGLIKDKDGTINGRTTYARILIKNKHPEEGIVI